MKNWKTSLFRKLKMSIIVPNLWILKNNYPNQLGEKLIQTIYSPCQPESMPTYHTWIYACCSVVKSRRNTLYKYVHGNGQLMIYKKHPFQEMIHMAVENARRRWLDLKGYKICGYKKPINWRMREGCILEKKKKKDWKKLSTRLNCLKNTFLY